MLFLIIAAEGFLRRDLLAVFFLEAVFLLREVFLVAFLAVFLDFFLALFFAMGSSTLKSQSILDTFD